MILIGQKTLQKEEHQINLTFFPPFGRLVAAHTAQQSVPLKKRKWKRIYEPWMFYFVSCWLNRATGGQACCHKWRKKAPCRSHAKLTRTRVSPTWSGLCSGVGRAAGNERVASIFHTLAARQEPHYLGFQPPGRPCYPQVLSIVSCRIIRLSAAAIHGGSN